MNCSQPILKSDFTSLFFVICIFFSLFCFKTHFVKYLCCKNFTELAKKSVIFKIQLCQTNVISNIMFYHVYELKNQLHIKSSRLRFT